MAGLRRALTLVVAACAGLALAAPAGAAPAPVPCWPSGGGHFTCTWYPAGDGRTGAALSEGAVQAVRTPLPPRPNC